MRLVGADAEPDQLAITSKAAASLARMQRRFEPAPIVPLADWRARTPDPLWRDSRVDPILPDEVLAPVATDPADPVALASLMRLSCPGLRPALTWENVLVLPSPNYFDWVQRGVQFECSDPVSFALLAGESSAAFPALRGWSAADCAHRAVTAHARWLQRSPAIDPDEAGTALGLLLGAGRAAVFWQSLARDEPELPLTVAAVVDRLGSEQPGGGGPAGRGAHRLPGLARWRRDPRSEGRDRASRLDRGAARVLGGTGGARARGASDPVARMKLFALLRFRDEAERLAAFFANVDPHVDGVVALDNGSTDESADLAAREPKLVELISRPRDVPFDDGLDRRLLTQTAIERGGDWLLGLDADERIERSFGERVRARIADDHGSGHDAYSLPWCDLWDRLDRFRVDGVWGKSEDRPVQGERGASLRRSAASLPVGFPIRPPVRPPPEDRRQDLSPRDARARGSAAAAGALPRARS